MDAYIASTTISHAKPNLQPLLVDPYGLLWRKMRQICQNISKDSQYVQLFNHLMLRCCQPILPDFLCLPSALVKVNTNIISLGSKKGPLAVLMRCQTVPSSKYVSEQSVSVPPVGGTFFGWESEKKEPRNQWKPFLPTNGAATALHILRQWMPLENQVGPTNLLCEQHKLRRNPRKKGSNRKSKNQTTVTKSNHTCGLPIPKLLSEMFTLMLQKSIWQILKHANKDTMSSGSIMTGALVQAYIFYSHPPLLAPENPCPCALFPGSVQFSVWRDEGAGQQ